MLRSSVRASIAVTGDRSSIQTLRIELDHIPDLELLHGSGSVIVNGFCPANLLACLQAAVLSSTTLGPYCHGPAQRVGVFPGGGGYCAARGVLQLPWEGHDPSYCHRRRQSNYGYLMFTVLGHDDAPDKDECV
jgi:hypothetical protein